MILPKECPICLSCKIDHAWDSPRDYEYDVRPARTFRYYRCRTCESEFLYPRPTEEEIPSFYPSDYHAYHHDHGVVASTLVGLRSRLRAASYRQFVPNGRGRLFDVGAGDCRHFDELKKHGCDFEFAGIEIQPEIAAHARMHGYAVSDGMLETMDLDGHRGRYDLVSMNHLIEHVFDPLLLVERAFQLLRPGGYILGQLPCLDGWERRIFGHNWGGYHFPRHLQGFSRNGLEHVLRSAGFEDIRITSALHLQTALSLQNTLVHVGWKPKMRHGKCPLYSFLLLAAAPFEAAAWVAGRTGVINFHARKPESRE